MEQTQNSEYSTTNEEQINIPEQSRQHFTEIGKWTKFLSIIGFVFTVLMVVMAFFAGSILSLAGNETDLPLPGFLIGFIYLIFAVIYFFPILYLYRFSVKIKEYLSKNETDDFKTAISNLKSHYKFIGILTLIMLVMYGLLFIGGMLISIIAL